MADQLQLFVLPAAGRPRRRRPSSQLLDLMARMRAEYRARLGVPLDVSWGRDMAQLSRKLRSLREESTAEAQPEELILAAWRLYLDDPSSEAVGYSLVGFWARYQRYLLLAADEARGIRRAPPPPAAPPRPPRWTRDDNRR